MSYGGKAMQKVDQETPKIEIMPASAERWAALEALFGPQGASAGCWCTFWRLKRADFNALDDEGRKAVLRELTLSNRVPGVLAYVDGKAVGWCSIGPREDFAALEGSRVFKRTDDQPVWSIVCFYVAKGYRRQGMMAALLRGAVEYARSQGATIIEGYPNDLESPKLAGKKLSGDGGYMGIASAFREAGFVEVGRASETKLIMRNVCPASEQST
jgi:GNAT superfamily N-acetyltransferase